MGTVNVGRGPIVVSLAVIAAIVGGVLGSTRAQVQSVSSSQTETSDTSAVIDVHVAGWVLSPGVVTVAAGAIVADAIAAAGGLRFGAAADQINLAAPVRPGDQIVVPGSGLAGSDSSSGDGLVGLNRADAADLQELPGVGPVLAERIVAFREENGPFRTVEDLLQVPGIGEAKLASIRDLIRLP